MKFEQLLQIYWSRGFLFGGKTLSFNQNLSDLLSSLPGLSVFARIKFFKRFELEYLLTEKDKNLTTLSLDKRKIFNMYFSQLISINNSIFELIRYNLIRLFLIKTYRGKCHVLGKPVRGQRTRSNSSNSYKCNRLIRLFINNVKKHNVIEKKPESLNKKILKKKIKKNTPKIKMIFLKKKKSLWF